jgi:energy-coupling factor transporter ATP-binding protein EcfA2
MSRGFKSLESVEIELGQVNVFIGANGSGKSNLLEAISVIGAAAFGRVDEESLTRRGCRPGIFYKPMFESPPPAQETTIEAIGTDGSSYLADLAGPDFNLSRQRGTAWQFKREVLNSCKEPCGGKACRQWDGFGRPRSRACRIEAGGTGIKQSSG